MRNIKDFYNHLSDKERDLITKSFQGNARSSKRKLLLNKINNYDEFAESVIARDMYDGAPNSSYSHLKRRLKEDIIDIVYDNEVSDQSNQSILADKVRCQKHLMQASLLVERGFKEEAKTYLKLAERIIDERQFSIERFMLHLTQLEVNELPIENAKVCNEIVKDIDKISDLGFSKIKFQKLKIQGYKASDIGFNYTNNLNDNNALSGYYKLLTEMKTFIELFQYSNALEYVQKLSVLVQKSARSFSHSEILNAQIRHLEVLVLNKELKSASVLSQHIERGKDLRFDMEIELTIIQWKIAYFSKDYLKAQRIWKKLDASEHATESDKYIIAYFKLCLLFQDKEFEEITILILKNNSLQSMNSPIPHAVKMLEIYCLLELGKNELAMSKLLALKQYLKRNHTLNRDRHQFLVKILIKLIKSNFKYGLTLSQYRNYAKESFVSDIRFIPDTYHCEFIEVESWLKNKSVEVGDFQCETVII